MYYYIYDQFLNQKKYDKILAQIESKITDLGIKDRIIKMSILKSVTELVTDALRKGAETLVVAGNDQTVHQLVNLIAGREVVLGIIPIGEHNSIANFLGLKDPTLACEIIAARKIESINLGEINGDYFVHSIKVHEPSLKLECNNKFSITSLSPNDIISIYNFAPEIILPLNTWGNRKFFNPQDNFLEVVVEPKNEKTFYKKILKPLLKDNKNSQPESVFRVKKVNIKNPTGRSSAVIVDNFKVLKTPLEVKISDKKLRVIVGRERKF